jgi:hypothetical protein
MIKEIWYVNCPWCERSIKQEFKGQFKRCPTCRREVIEETIQKIVDKGFFKIGITTYMLEQLEYPHDENCEGTMCWCNTRAKKQEKLNQERQTR